MALKGGLHYALKKIQTLTGNVNVRIDGMATDNG